MVTNWQVSSQQQKKQKIKRKIESPVKTVSSAYNNGQARSPTKETTGTTGGLLVPSRKGRKLEVPEKPESDTNSIGTVWK